MKNRNKKVIAILLSALVVTGVSGCGSSEDSKTADEEINIRVASVYVEGHSMNSVFTDVLNEFQEKHPNVKITEEFMPSEQLSPKLKTDAASNNMPDIFPVWVDSTNKDDIEAGLWLNLQEELDANSEWKDSFNAGTLEQFQYEGIEGTWAAPICTYGVGFFYNKELFEKVGAEVPETWAELLDVIQKLKDGGITPWALGAKDTWRAEHLFTNIYYRLNGIEQAQKISDRSIDYDDESFLKTFEKMEELVNIGAFDADAIGLDYSQEVAAFAAGNVGMQLNGAWGIGETDGANAPDTIKGKIGYFAFPAFEGAEMYANNWMGGVNDAFAVSAKVEGEKKELVLELLQDLTNADTAKRIAEETGNLPAVATEYDEEKVGTLMPVVMECINQADAFAGDITGFETDASVSEKVYNYTQAILAGLKTPKEICSELAELTK